MVKWLLVITYMGQNGNSIHTNSSVASAFCNQTKSWYGTSLRNRGTTCPCFISSTDNLLSSKTLTGDKMEHFDITRFDLDLKPIDHKRIQPQVPTPTISYASQCHLSFTLLFDNNNQIHNFLHQFHLLCN